MPARPGPQLRLTDEQRTAAIAECRDLYERDRMSIRAISKKSDCSYGLVHKLLTEGGVKLRRRGGSHRHHQ